MEFGIETLKTIEAQRRADLQNELILQGHYLTGALDRSLNVTPLVLQDGSGLSVTVEALDYITNLNEGVPPEHIDFQQDIALMTEYIKKRKGFSDRYAAKVGYLIALKHQKEGNPTEASVRFSKTGTRIFAIQESDHQEVYDKLFESGMDNEIDQLLSNSFDQISF